MNTTTLNPVLKITRMFDAPPDARVRRLAGEGRMGRLDRPGRRPLRYSGVRAARRRRYHLVMHISGRGDIPVEGVFKTIDRPHRFSFTWGWALGGHGDTLVSVTLKDLGGKTELTLTHEGLPTADDREGHGKGWNSTLNKLALYVKGERK